MSLLDTASFLLTPNAHKEGKLYSVIPSDGSGDMSVTRATTATRVNSDGLVELVPYNLLQRSQEFDNAIWTKSASGTGVIPVVTANYATAPDGTLTADRVQINSNAAGLSQIAQTFTGPINTIGTFSIWMKSLTSNVTVTMFVGATTGNKTVTTEWQRFTFSNTSLASINDARIAKRDVWGSGGNADILLWGAQVVEGTNALPYQKTETRLNIPRLDYSLGGCPSILLEPQRTNLALQSSYFDSATWTKTALTVTANNAISPSGIIDADTLVADGVSAEHIVISNSISFTSGTAYSFSVFAKKGTNNFIQLFMSSTIGGMFANFDLNNGSVGTLGTLSGTAPTSSIEDYGNGWYRCEIKFTATATTSRSVNVAIVTSASAARAENNTLTTSLLLWGAQLEAGAYATSYIPTTTSTITRNLDVLSKTGVSSLLNPSEGTVFLEIGALANDLTNRAFQISDGTDLNIITIQFNTTVSNRIRFQTVGNGGTFIYLADGIVPITNMNKLLISWKSGNIFCFINGVKYILTLLSGAGNGIPTSLNRINFQTWWGGQQMFANVKQLAIWKTQLTDAECISLTTI